MTVKGTCFFLSVDCSVVCFFWFISFVLGERFLYGIGCLLVYLGWFVLFFFLSLGIGYSFILFTKYRIPDILCLV